MLVKLRLELGHEGFSSPGAKVKKDRLRKLFTDVKEHGKKSCG